MTLSAIEAVHLVEAVERGLTIRLSKTIQAFSAASPFSVKGVSES